MLFPKPGKQKRTKERKKPPLFEMGYCMRCYWKYGIKHIQGKDKHHIWGGTANRKISEFYGAYIDLCREPCHRLVTDEKDQEFIQWLDEEAKRRFIAEYGETKYQQEILGRYILEG